MKPFCGCTTRSGLIGPIAITFSPSPAARCGVCSLTSLARKPRSREARPQYVTLDDNIPATGPDHTPLELIALDEALDALGAIDPRKVQVVELRFFAGLSVEETAAVLDVSPDTVTRDWRLARSWLIKQLDPQPGSVR